MLSINELDKLNRYFNAANYLSVGQLYLLDNPLLERPLEITDIKKRIIGHYGTTPGQNFIFTHLNRIIVKDDLNMMVIVGPGHGGNAFISNAYLDGSYSEVYPNITKDKEGMKKLFKQFSFPGGVSSHASPEVPGSINEGGELGYSLAHAYGAVLNNKDLICTCIVGDGEAETGSIATSWHLNKIINKKDDGVVLPILHLNGYKISNPTILSRISEEELINLFKGYGYEPILVSGSDVNSMHQKMADALDYSVNRIKQIKAETDNTRPIYPMIILKTPKGWTGPKVVDGKNIENSFRSHQVPLLVDKDHMENLIPFENWMRSYHIEEVFDKDGNMVDDLIIPKGDKRLSSNPNTNGGKLLKELDIPNFENYMIDFDTPGTVIKQDMIEAGKFIGDILDRNRDNFKLFCPDEALSNRLNHIFDKNSREFNAEIYNTDEYLNTSGNIIDSYLSENVCEGMLEGYLLTGRHGLFVSYEAFVRVVDSMISEHAKWIKMSKELPWRKEISSLNLLLTSHLWQQDHNGYTHQDPGLLNHLISKKSDIIRMYVPCDTNTLLSCIDHTLKTKNYINVVIGSKHPRYQWFNKEDALRITREGLGIVDYLSDEDPDVVLVSSGDTPTLELFAAHNILKEFTDIKIRVVNVVDLYKLESSSKSPHGLTDLEFNQIFTIDKPIIYNFHGYPDLIHQLTYKRYNKNLHVHGYMEEGTITTPFDQRVRNNIDRYHIALDVIKYVQNENNDKVKEYCENMLKKHNEYIKEYGVDMPEIENFKLKTNKNTN